MNKTLQETVLEKVTPTAAENEQISAIAAELEQRILDAVKTLELEIKVEPILVGSVAKSTHLVRPDIDIFMMFPEATPRAKLENYALRIGRMVIPEGQERYAEHPYISGTYKGFEADIVPCYRIQATSDLKSAVDRTPFHTQYIKENLAEKLIQDVRLLKQILKGIGVYGAEVEIQGFSGYLCELLIIYYHGFSPLLEAARGWELHKYISLENGPEPNDNNNEFENDPLIFIDPVDPNRNVASALSQNNLELFRYACQCYCENPQLEFFFPNDIQPLSASEISNMIETRATKFIGLNFKTPAVIPDILYSQLRKAERAITRSCEHNGFKIKDSSFTVLEKITSLMLFEFERFELPYEELHLGPPGGNKNAEKFINKWSVSEKALEKPYLDDQDNRWKVKIQREFPKVKDLIAAKIYELGLGKHINLEVKKGFEVLADVENVRPEYLRFLTRFLIKKYRWEY